METLKEAVVDILAVVAVWFIITAGSVVDHASRGLSCGGTTSAVTQKAP